MIKRITIIILLICLAASVAASCSGEDMPPTAQDVIPGEVSPVELPPSELLTDESLQEDFPTDESPPAEHPSNEPPQEDLTPGEYITIRGERYSTDLTELWLPDILTGEDIAPLKYMVNLEYLTISVDGLYCDLSPLAGLTNLEEIFLDSDQAAEIADWSPVAHVQYVTGRP